MSYIHKKPAWNIPESKITPQEFYLSRRKFLSSMGLGLGALTLNNCLSVSGSHVLSGTPPEIYSDDFVSPEGYANFIKTWNIVPEENDSFVPGRNLTDSTYPLNYNNYYEFSVQKERVASLSANFQSEPWKLRIHGLVEKELTFDLDDLIHLADLETRIYRHRCVEAWAMTVPWIGYPLSKLLEKASPTSKAKFVKFTSFHDPEQAPGQASGYYVNNFPYYEGLTLPEAMNELTLLTFGLYDTVLPNQNGAPLRVVVPWKYGYKGPKAVVDIEIVEAMPPTFWSDLQPTEYPFESNVNPNKPHPRWSQRMERLLGPDPQEMVPTQIYNGYGEWVSHLYP